MNTHYYCLMLSSANRNELIKKISDQRFDLIIIGGGITGAGIALDASSRGMKVLLLEKNDFAGGTSSKSTKLIHGGLRYLKQLEFSLVRKVGRERAVIHDLAPHLVRPQNMLLPIYKKGNLGKFTTSVALWIYDNLAKVKHKDRYRMLGPLQVSNTEPLLKTEGLIGGALYKEYRTDDARLTIEILKTAVNLGAVAINYAGVEKFIYSDKKISGVIFRNYLNDETFEIHASKIINAAGPWVDELRTADNSLKGKKLHLTKGIHIVVDAAKFPLLNAVYFDDPKQERMIFAIPRQNKIYIGTTDTNYSGDKQNIPVDIADINYLLNSVNAIFNSVELKIKDVESAWAGLRPLIHKEGKSPAELSRRDEIFVSDSGLISIAGGKLTGYRKMAEQAVDIVAGELVKSNKNIGKSPSAKIKIHGFIEEDSIEEFIERRIGESKQIGLTRDEIVYLVNNYGSDAEKIIDIAFELHESIPDPQQRILKAEIIYGIQNEGVTSCSDFLIRRTGRLYFDKHGCEKIFRETEQYIQEILNVTEVIKMKHIQAFEKELGLINF